MLSALEGFREQDEYQSGSERLPRQRHYDDWSKENTREDFQPAGCVVLHEDNSYASFFLRVQSLAPAHSLPSTSGERKIRHVMIQMYKKQKKKRKKEKHSFSLTINAKALCLSEKSIFPSVLHCTNGGGICISK